jgi:glyoxylase-like metal-dependent hydrolase (beta-lactamase superfamily II)
MKRIIGYLFVIAVLFQFSCTNFEDFKVIPQVAGPIETNCYLIYGTKSKEAALIDPGWRTDTLTAFVKENNLNLKYIFITHGHIDHFYFLPELKKQFPKASWCMQKDDYQGIFTYPEWALKNYGQAWVDSARRDPELKEYIDFDSQLIGVPDIFVEDNQTFKLGFSEIKTILSPGHSPGGICYYIGNILFSGDVLFYRTVGRTDTQYGSRDDQIKSVRKLYEFFPDSTIVYPGHGKFTDIGSEKKENSRITVDGGAWITK